MTPFAPGPRLHPGFEGGVIRVDGLGTVCVCVCVCGGGGGGSLTLFLLVPPQAAGLSPQNTFKRPFGMQIRGLT